MRRRWLHEMRSSFPSPINSESFLRQSSGSENTPISVLPGEQPPLPASPASSASATFPMACAAPFLLRQGDSKDLPRSVCENLESLLTTRKVNPPQHGARSDGRIGGTGSACGQRHV